MEAPRGGSRAEEAENLARLVGDPERLLPNEEPRTTDVVVAEHWVGVHRQVLELRVELMKELRRHLEHVADPAVLAGLNVNLQGLQLSVQRSRVRLAYWRDRLDALRAAVASAMHPD